MAAEIIPILSALEDDQALSQVARLLLERNHAQQAKIQVSNRRVRKPATQVGSAKARVNPVSEAGQETELADRPTGGFTGSYHSLSAQFGRGPYELSIDVHRESATSAFSSEALDELQMLGQPLIAAIAVRNRLQTALRDRARSRAVVELVATPVLLLDTEGCLLDANGAGRALLKSADGLQLRAGKIDAYHTQAKARLSATLAQLNHTPPGEPRAVSIDRGNGSSYLLVLTKRMVAAEQLIIGLIADPDARIGAVLPLLRGLFGLGVAEAEIACAIARGLDPDAIAAARSTSVATVRSQLKAITAKMGCSRQSDIVRIVLSIPALTSP